MKRLIFLTDQTRMGSSQCRGYDIADKLNTPIDIPIENIKPNDTVIMIKKLDKKVFKYTNNIYCDIVDGTRAIYEDLKELPNIKIITLSPQGVEFVKNIFPQHEIMWIPHTHCNDEKRIRQKREVKRILYNGTDGGFPIKLWNKFSSIAEKNGFETVRFHTVADKNNINNLRKSCCSAYYHSDIQVSFRIQSLSIMPLIMKCATKLNNAGSFAIPSVAFPEPAFEYNYNKKGSYVPVNSIDEMVLKCIELRDDKKFYEKISSQALMGAQPYHINEVIKWYEKI